MNEALAEAIDTAIKIADQPIPTSYQYLENLRRQCADLLDAVNVFDEDLAVVGAPIRDSWQWAQLMASAWQLASYVRGQPLYPEYVQSTFDATRRRVLAVADLVTALERQITDVPTPPKAQQ